VTPLRHLWARLTALGRWPFVCHTPPLTCLWCGATIPVLPRVQVLSCAEACRVGPYGWWQARGKDITETGERQERREP
jgi:hypothetical protein